MVTELDSTPSPETKQYSDDEISRILATAQATRKERDEAAKRAKELEIKVNELSGNLEKIKGIDPNKYQRIRKISPDLRRTQTGKNSAIFLNLRSVGLSRKQLCLLKFNNYKRTSSKTRLLTP
ncbi:hypothetical protein FD724_06670 [Nostoc sp. C057]|uniref:hypothetical protein n=1 Tax=Nostoc sp. C057 TaxID=2576903 RepID=UPI0015C3F036|nr:hypothetical protein [Nostoc sp. C057]QLE47823.1 hypothetical protein FD724_06670 [Nostoc sp. C057]